MILKDYLKILPVLWNNKMDAINDHSVNHPAYRDAYCNIVTESEAATDIELIESTVDYGHLQVITEKSYKPFISCQIPVILACKGHIRYLKSLGFEMMEDLLPSGYDDMYYLDKITAIGNLVNQGHDYIKEFYFSHVREIEHNYELVTSDKVDNLILQNIKDIINGRS